jgi:glycosyltransferase involved in cell wall biosynthesis
MTIINQENKGISVGTENLLKQVKTKWCCFLDADDYYAPTAFSTMFKYIKDDTDILISKTIWWKKNTLYKGRRYNWFNKKTTLEKYFKKCVFCCLWNKMYRYEFVKQCNLFFPAELKWHSDRLTSIQLLLNDPKLAFCTKHTYYYINSGTNLSQKKSYHNSKYAKELLIKIHNWIYKKYGNKYTGDCLITYKKYLEVINDPRNKNIKFK